MANRFAKLLFPMLLLCIISLTALVSFSEVRGTGVVLQESNSSNYFSRLNLKEQQAQTAFNNSHCSDPQLMQRLAMLYWQNDKVDRAQDYLDELWDRHANGNDAIHYDPVFVQDGLNAASLYLARGVNNRAQQIYERLIDYESGHLPATDPRLGREYNNLGLTYLRSAEANDQLQKRMYWFKQSLEQSKKAEKIFRSSPQYNPQLICCLQNQVVTYSEMGDDDKALKLSKIVNAQLDAWHDHRNIPPPDTVN